MNKLYTLGYQGSTPGDVRGYVATLEALVVDIRYSPWSQNPAWRKTALAALVGPASYRWLQSLGNTNYKTGGPIHLAAPAQAVPVLAAILAVQPAILLCGCADVTACHRRTAADYLAGELGCTIEHLPGSITRWAERE